MKLALVTRRYPPLLGGAEKHLSYLAPALAAAGAGLSAGYASRKIHSLPNGVPVPADPWRRRHDWKSAPRAAFVGRLAPEKGLDTLIEAWPQVLARHPNARLTLVGDGPQRGALEGLV